MLRWTSWCPWRWMSWQRWTEAVHVWLVPGDFRGLRVLTLITLSVTLALNASSWMCCWRRRIALASPHPEGVRVFSLFFLFIYLIIVFLKCFVWARTKKKNMIDSQKICSQSILKTEKNTFNDIFEYFTYGKNV